RYVDDFIVVCKTKNEAKLAENYSKELLEKEDLELSEDSNKTRTINLIRNNDYIEFLGLKISKDRIEPKKKPLETIEWMKENVLKKGSYEKRLLKDENGKIIGRVSKIEQINEIIMGWANFYKFYHADKHFDFIDKHLEKLKKTKPFFKKILLLRGIKKEEIFSKEEWQNCF